MARAGYILIAHDIGASEPALELDDAQYLPAIGLFTLCLCYCDRQLTDGRIPRRALRVIAPGIDCGKAMAELERVGLMAPTPDGWTVPDYLEWQRSRDEVEAAAERARKAARYRWDAPHASSNASGNASGNATSECLRALRASKEELSARARDPVENSTIRVARAQCPRCETDVTYDEIGEHCVMCGWRPDEPEKAPHA